MNRKLMTTTAALFIAAGAALASPQTDAIVAELQAMNATNIQVKVGLFRIKAEAYINGVKVERTYSTDGTLLKEETIIDGQKVERVFDANGNPIRVEMGDDHGDDDHGFDDSGNHDGDDDHDRSHDSGDDDHGRDRHGDDHDRGRDHGGHD